jgi:hypothetical protein
MVPPLVCHTVKAEDFPQLSIAVYPTQYRVVQLAKIVLDINLSLGYCCTV